MKSDYLLIAAGAIAINMCIVVIILLPLVLSLVSDARWCWVYVFYSLFVLYHVWLMVKDRKEGEKEGYTEKEGKNQ